MSPVNNVNGGPQAHPHPAAGGGAEDDAIKSEEELALKQAKKKLKARLLEAGTANPMFSKDCFI